jgi:hypothetical protein
MPSRARTPPGKARPRQRDSNQSCTQVVRTSCSHKSFARTKCCRHPQTGWLTEIASTWGAVERAGSVVWVPKGCGQDEVLLSFQTSLRPRMVVEHCWLHSNTTSLIPSRLVLRHHAEAPLTTAPPRSRHQRRPSVTPACPRHHTVRPQAPCTSCRLPIRTQTIQNPCQSGERA